MIAESVKFRGHRCFKKEWAGFDTIKPVNVIIGKNNTGKSHLLDLVKDSLCASTLIREGWEFRCEGAFDEKGLRRKFSEGTTSGILEGNHWTHHGRNFVNQTAVWETDVNQNITAFEMQDSSLLESRYGIHSTNERIARLKDLVLTPTHLLSGKIFRHLVADRDISPEAANQNMSLTVNGIGATNIIRRHITSASGKVSRDLIQNTLLKSLNSIFGDVQFTRIEVQHHDDSKDEFRDRWEIFLGEEKKGLVPLSRSGSGLKTVFLVLLNLLVIPEIENKSKSSYVFAFEELENNLHPALLRRLLTYIEGYAVNEKATIFLTTHSSVALDLFSLSNNAQIIHVTHDGESAKSQTIANHFEKLSVVSELGAKPSDLLQANGIIWCEGPSDRIYLNHWINIATDGKYKEGRDYQCAFYGGALLARAQFVDPDKETEDLANLFRINSNIIVVCDGDQTQKRARYKDRVKRIREEVNELPDAHIWITGAREIENYIPGAVLAKALELGSLPDPGQYDLFFPRKGQPATSFIETQINRKGLDKMDLAIQCVPLMDKANMSGRFDWANQIAKIAEKIESWNR